MRIRPLWKLALVLLVLPGPVSAMEVAELKIAQEVIGREPVGVADRFAPSVGELLCYTRLEGAAPEDSVTHVWRYGDREMARVALPVRSSNWRTWSSKKILPSWTGRWRVDVLDGEGAPLARISFVVGEEPNERP